MSAPRKTYCRACGENKDHNFGKCKNVAAIRRIVLSQDGELQEAKAEVLRLRPEQDKRVQQEGQAIVMGRIIRALLELIETRKQ